MLKKLRKVLFPVLCVSTSSLLFLLMISPSAFFRRPENFMTEVDDTGVEGTPLQNMLAKTVQSSSSVTTPISLLPMNPGCVTRRLEDYIPVGTKSVYHHPPIVQYAMLYSTPVSLSFMDYMAMMSAYKSLKPERIIVLTYTNITGKYWKLAQQWKNTSVDMLKIPRVQFQNSRFVTINHQADFSKLSSLLKYGGVISDFDVIIVNGTKLKHMQSISECVLSREGDYINAGFSSCVRNSSFIQKWINTYHDDYRPHLWLHNSAYMPKYILETNTSNVCHNMYLVKDIATQPTYAEAGKEWLKKDGVKWEDKVAAHYFNRLMRKFDATVLDKDHSFGKMLRYIWEM